jgi:dTDP-4-dehydrorhamnose 3,5-epimerase
VSEIVPLSVSGTDIDGLMVITLRNASDDRGTVREFYRESDWLAAGLPSLGHWLQINVTESKRAALRGLHGEQMNKLVGIVSGDAFGGYVDARPDSPTRGKVATVPLVAGTAVLVPNGVCNGFQTVSESSQYLYCFDAEWAVGMAGPSVDALDPELGITWPLPPVLSGRDSSLPKLSELLGP